MTSPFVRFRYVAILVFAVLTVNLLMAQRPLERPDGDIVPDGHVQGVQEQTMPAVPGPVGDAVVTGNGINYHGGPVMKANPVKYYVIWYGNWSGTGSNTAATVSLVEHFISTLGGTPYEHIATTYGDNSGNVSGNVSFGGHTFVNTTTNLNDTRLRT